MIRTRHATALLATLAGALWLVIPLRASALDGSQLALRSTGLAAGGDWTLDQNGYVGSYVTLATPGDVTISVAAAGQNGGGVDPRMNLVIGDQRFGFDVTAAFNSYQHTFSLPAGTHFIRTEYANDFVGNAVPAANRSLTVRSFDVAGANLANDNTDANALAAADTYVQYGRQGAARVDLLGAQPGAAVHVKLANHAFNWGSNIYGTENTNPPPLSIPQFNQFFRDHFNMVVPSRAGKWNNNESTRDVVTNISSGYLDSILDFAEANGMKARMHNLIWGNSTGSHEQPAWVVNMLNNPNSLDFTSGKTNLNALRDEISERIDYYVGDGPGGLSDFSLRYDELDVYNESYHTGSNAVGSNNYWDRYGAVGIADIYDETAQAIAASGSHAKLYLNEYNVLQNGDDDYGNWYKDQIEAIQNADSDATNGPVSGVGMQLYPVNGLSPAYMQQVMQNLAVLDLPQSITEFGVQNSVVNPALAKQYVNESLRMAFGNPEMTTFMYWGIWASATSNLQSASVLTNADWSLTDIGKMYEDMMGIQDWDGNPDNAWSTDLMLSVGPDGAIDFTGFYGDYDVTIDGQTFSLSLEKGTSDYALVVGPPSGDFNLDGLVDGEDFLAWQRGFGASGTTHAQGDADYDGDVDAGDLAVWKSGFGVAAAPLASNVPEPNAAALIVVAANILAWRRRQSA